MSWCCEVISITHYEDLSLAGDIFAADKHITVLFPEWTDSVELDGSEPVETGSYPDN